MDQRPTGLPDPMPLYEGWADTYKKFWKCMEKKYSNDGDWQHLVESWTAHLEETLPTKPDSSPPEPSEDVFLPPLTPPVAND
jgi:hypothetical protein